MFAGQFRPSLFAELSEFDRQTKVAFLSLHTVCVLGSVPVLKQEDGTVSGSMSSKRPQPSLLAKKTRHLPPMG